MLRQSTRRSSSADVLPGAECERFPFGAIRLAVLQLPAGQGTGSGPGLYNSMNSSSLFASPSPFKSAFGAGKTSLITSGPPVPLWTNSGAVTAKSPSNCVATATRMLPGTAGTVTRHRPSAGAWPVGG